LTGNSARIMHQVPLPPSGNLDGPTLAPANHHTDTLSIAVAFNQDEGTPSSLMNELIAEAQRHELQDLWTSGDLLADL
jgi:hypothetical protein